MSSLKPRIYQGSFGCWVCDIGCGVHRNFSEWRQALSFGLNYDPRHS